MLREYVLHITETEVNVVMLVAMMTSTWRFMGSSTWGYKSPIKGYKYSYLTYNPTYNYPSTSKYHLQTLNPRDRCFLHCHGRKSFSFTRILHRET